MEAKHINISKSKLKIEDTVWLVDHDAIREYIEDYTMDQYSQIFDNLNEMYQNGLIEKII